MKRKLMILYFLVLTAMNTRLMIDLVTAEESWIKSCLSMGLLLGYLYSISALLYKITAFYSSIPKNSTIYYLQAWRGNTSIMLLLLLTITYVCAVLSKDYNELWLIFIACVGLIHTGDIYQVVYINEGLKYYYSDKLDKAVEITSYEKKDKYIALNLSRADNAIVSTCLRSRRSRASLEKIFP
jgi:hypothetical protein